MRTFLYSLSPSQASWIGKGGIGGPAMALRKSRAKGPQQRGSSRSTALQTKPTNQSETLEHEQASTPFHNRKTARLWKALSTLKDPETRKRKPQPAMPASPEVWTAASACPHSARQRPRRRFAARRPAPENRDVGLASRQKALRSARWMLAPSIHRVASHTLPPLRDPRRVPSWESLCKATRAHRPEPALALGRAAR